MRILALCRVALVTLFAGGLKADIIAFMGTVSGQFGTVDLNTGVFSLLGNSGATLAGMAVANATLYGSSYHTATGTLYSVNQANGSLTVVGTTSVDYDDFGSTTSGLYAVGVDANLYSINSGSAIATLIGPTGLSFGSVRSLSTNSSTLYFADGPNLYTLNTTTGAATLIGSTGGAQMGALLLEGGILYAGEDSPGLRVDTLNITTGAATTGPTVAGTSSLIFGFAPNPLPSSAVPEPRSMMLLGTGITALALLRRRRVIRKTKKSC
jgi:hypothetical protein